MEWIPEEMVKAFDDGSAFKRAYLALLDLQIDDRLECFSLFCMGCGKQVNSKQKNCKCDRYEF